jgi:ligand-binding SRPBCC domain-containing protein
MTVVERTTQVPAPAGAVWERVTSMEGINHELRPWMRMTVPRAARDMTLEDVELGQPVGRSWVLALGVIPFDYDDVTLVERGPGMRFLERSPMGSMRLWQHERFVEPEGEERCALTDRLTFEPKIPGAGRVGRWLVERIFRHRHRRLVSWAVGSRRGPAPG